MSSASGTDLASGQLDKARELGWDGVDPPPPKSLAPAAGDWAKVQTSEETEAEEAEAAASKIAAIRKGQTSRRAKEAAAKEAKEADAAASKIAAIRKGQTSRRQGSAKEAAPKPGAPRHVPSATSGPSLDAYLAGCPPARAAKEAPDPLSPGHDPLLNPDLPLPARAMPPQAEEAAAASKIAAIRKGQMSRRAAAPASAPSKTAAVEPKAKGGGCCIVS